MPNNWIWLGFNDVEQEGIFVDDEGLQMSWSNWKVHDGNIREPNGGDIAGWFMFVSRIIYQTNLFKYIRYQIKCEQ